MSPDISTRALLHAIAEGDPASELTLGGLLDQFKTRAYGVFLLMSVLPAFVPLPVGAGAISGPLVSLIGLQLLAQMEHPWVPRFLSRRPLSRPGMVKFRDRTARVLRWVEKVSRPRTEAIIDHPAARTFTGLMLVLLGLLLALPLPGTNYPFGLILLAYAIALIERDGRLMLVAWAMGLGQLAVVGVLSGQIAGLLADFFSWVGKLFS